jgi:hypothetical protein
MPAALDLLCDDDGAAVRSASTERRHATSAKMRADAAHRSGSDLQPIFATLAHRVTHQQYKRMRCVRAHPHLRLSSAVAMDGAVGLLSSVVFEASHGIRNRMYRC